MFRLHGWEADRKAWEPAESCSAASCWRPPRGERRAARNCQIQHLLNCHASKLDQDHSQRVTKLITDTRIMPQYNLIRIKIFYHNGRSYLLSVSHLPLWASSVYSSLESFLRSSRHIYLALKVYKASVSLWFFPGNLFISLFTATAADTYADILKDWI